MNRDAAQVQTIDDYIADFPQDVQALLEKLRCTISAAAPAAVESISYRIPTFKRDGRALVYFAGYEKHIGLYPVELDGSRLAQRLAPYASGRATLKFPLGRPVPWDLITQVVRDKLRKIPDLTIRTKRRAGAVERLDVRFTAVLLHDSVPNAWHYVVWPKSVEYFGTKGRVKVEATVDDVPMTTSFMAMGDGRHMLPIKAAVRRVIGKAAGDRVKIELRARLR